MPFDPIAQQFTIAPTQGAVVLGPNFLHSLAEVEREVAHGPDATQAMALRDRLDKASAALEEARKKARAPFQGRLQEIEDMMLRPYDRIHAARMALSKIIAEAPPSGDLDFDAPEPVHF